ncbi:hypothetical protein BZA77DRAFT_299080 [Pyronema omphalodes]|nr:hypothetical protein BZA77DRAFT_299080 [Pyronema omphalodes]
MKFSLAIIPFIFALIAIAAPGPIVDGSGLETRQTKPNSGPPPRKKKVNCSDTAGSACGVGHRSCCSPLQCVARIRPNVGRQINNEKWCQSVQV